MLRNKSLKINRLNGLAVYRIAIFLLCFLSAFSPLCAQEEFVYEDGNRRDPFIPLVTPDGRLLKLEPQEQTKGLLLEGIIYDKFGLSYALVNGEALKIGDQISDYTVLKIEKNRVIFIKEGELTEIELKKEEP